MTSLKNLGLASPADVRLPPQLPAGTNYRTIRHERSWRSPDMSGGPRRLRPFAARWSGAERHELRSEITSEYHILSLSLQPTKFCLRLDGTWFPNTTVTPGTIQLTRPGQPARIVYHEPYDVLHLFIQNVFLNEFVEWCHGAVPHGSVAIRDPRFAHDPAFEQLGVALLSADEIGGPHGELYADALSLAIVARLFAFYGNKPASSQRTVGALPDWRLKRVTDFIESHVGEPVTLAELAQTVGLSRMHFAAQFRKATGVRPHEYVLLRRIAKAKAMLASDSLPIAAVALTVGFNSQAHFTSVFKRLAGLTPLQWREHNRR